VLALVKEHKLGPKRRPRRTVRARKSAAKAPAAVRAERKPRRSRPKPMPVDAGEE
jgi:hypothetical protein